MPKAAAKWALSKVGCRYSQAERTKKDVFDCSSLVARAYSAQGVSWDLVGSEVPNSTQEVYSDQFLLLWPEDYDDIGKTLGGKDVLKKAAQPGDLQFLCTDSDTTRSNRITHVAMVAGKDEIVHARSTKYGVCTNDLDLYAGKVCAVARFDPSAPLRRGMRGLRVKALQEEYGFSPTAGCLPNSISQTARRWRLPRICARWPRRTCGPRRGT